MTTATASPTTPWYFLSILGRRVRVPGPILSRLLILFEHVPTDPENGYKNFQVTGRRRLALLFGGPDGRRVPITPWTKRDSRWWRLVRDHGVAP